ncbi:MAG: ArgR family transcriptional regulator [Bacteroidales bacterium]
MQKTMRLLAIEKIIGEEIITSQEVLLKRLKAKGIICTQATLSRNLRQLGVSRIPDGTGGYRYFMTGAGFRRVNQGIKLNIVPVIQDIVEANGLMVIRTIPGNANATAYYIDNASRYEIAGTIAGDDTILIIPRNGVTMSQVHTCLELILPGLHKQVAGVSNNSPERNRII